ncbi:MAG: transposase [Deltaproteobacteria bacterium]|jgi:hypothetical protein|nr:transposase [Deltaproteobacteria bacterium]
MEIESADDFFLSDIQIDYVRSAGMEYLGLKAAEELDLRPILSGLKFSGRLLKIALLLIIGRMIQPSRYWEVQNWLPGSSLGELLELNTVSLSEETFGEVSQKLSDRQEEIEAAVYKKLARKSNSGTYIALYDISVTYSDTYYESPDIEYQYFRSPAAKKPSWGLALMYDGDSWIIKSRIIPGKISDPLVLDGLVRAFNPPSGTLFVMDHRIAGAKTASWLTENGFRWLAFKREQVKAFDESLAQSVPASDGGNILFISQPSSGSQEKSLICKKTAVKYPNLFFLRRNRLDYELELSKIAGQLNNPDAVNTRPAINELLENLDRRSSQVRQYYKVSLTAEPSGKPNTLPIVTSLDFKRKPIPISDLALPGICTFRTNELDAAPEDLCRIYARQYRMESLFRSLKVDLGRRPRDKENLIDTQLFLSVLAFQGASKIRQLLAAEGLSFPWESLAETMSESNRVRMILKSPAGPPSKQMLTATPRFKEARIYKALNIDLHKYDKISCRP